MTTDDTVTNGAEDPKEAESAPAEKVTNGESAPEKASEDPPKEDAAKKAKKSKKGKKGTTEDGESKAEPSADGEKKEEPGAEGDKKKKPIKKKIPQWATLSDKAKAATKASNI